LKVAIRERTSETNTTINQVRRIRKQVEDWEKWCSDRQSIRDAAKSLNEQLKAIEAELINVDFEKPRPGPNRIKEKFDALSSMIDESDDKPTRGAQEVYEMLRVQLETQLAKFKDLLEGPVTTFNDLIRSEGVPLVGV
jgi:DNA repair exonuclease SbcCD ATPase subunit